MHKPKVIITIRGGIVESVHASPALSDINVILLDYDGKAQGEIFTEDHLVAEREIEDKQVTEII